MKKFPGVLVALMGLSQIANPVERIARGDVAGGVAQLVTVLVICTGLVLLINGWKRGSK